MGISDKFSPHEGNEKTINTEIDNIMKIVEKRKKISMKEISVNLNISFLKTEHWCKKLAEKGTLKVNYPLIGHPIVMLEIKKKENKVRNKKLNLIIFIVILMTIFAFLIFLLKKYNFIY
jgi:hypothetical protein